MRLYHDSKEYANKRDPSMLSKILTAPVSDADLPVALDPEDEAQAQAQVAAFAAAADAPLAAES
jgi:hypothetical protein